jgi:hypothetical protein
MKIMEQEHDKRQARLSLLRETQDSYRPHHSNYAMPLFKEPANPFCGALMQHSAVPVFEPPPWLSFRPDYDDQWPVPDPKHFDSQLVPPLPEHEFDPWKCIYARSFENGEFDAYQTSTSPRAFHKELPLVCAMVREMNQHEPKSTDPQALDALLKHLRAMVFHVSQFCPGFNHQLQQVLNNKLLSIEDVRQNRCWNCGEPGHIKANCPKGHRKFSTEHPRR